MEIPAVVGLCTLAFLLGRAFQNWSNCTKEADRMAYQAGYVAGLKKGAEDGCNTGGNG